MKVAVTGADGRIGRKVCEELSKDHEIVPIDVRGIDPPVDVENLEALEKAIAGCDALIHLATYARSTKSPWVDVQHNIAGIHNAYEAARRVGAKHVIFASSNHAVGQYEVIAAHGQRAESDGPLFLGPDVPYRADGYYGAAKAFGEVLGRYYSDEYGMRVACVRIGTIRGDDSPDPADVSKDYAHLRISDEAKRNRIHSTWMSKLDFARLCRAILSKDVPYGIVYGVGNNPNRFHDLEAGRTLYGFWPTDGAGRG